MSVYVNNKYRVKRNLQYHEKMQALQKIGLFGSYRDIIMISAIIGVKNDCYVPIDKTAEGILMQFFTENDYDIIDIIAYKYKKEQSILKKDSKYDIFANFANGGFPILLEKLGIEFNEKNEVVGYNREAVIKKYYKLLLTNSFDINKEDLDKQLIKE